MVSCIFTLTDDLDAEFPAVAARALGLSRVPLLCAREVPVPGSLPRVIRVMVHYYAPEDHEPRHVYLGEARVLRARPRVGSVGPRARGITLRGAMPIEFAERTRRIPVYPLAAGYDLGADVAMLASNESCFAPLPAVVAGGRARARRGATAIRIPPTSRCAARSRTATGSRRSGSRSGTALATSCSPPARRCSSPVPRSSTRGPRSACTRISPRRRARARSRYRSTTRTVTTSTRSPTEVTVATRLVMVCNPNNPTSTAIGLDEIDAFMRRIPGHVRVILDEAYCEFSLTLGDTYASLDLLRKYPNLVLLRTFSKVYGLAALRVGYALCGAEDFRVAVDQVRQPFYLNARRAGGRGRGARAPGRGRAARDRDDRGRGSSSRTGCGRSGCGWRESDANFIWLHLPETVEEADVVAGLRERRRARARRRCPRA